MIAVTDLRKIFSAQGVKGFGSANRAAFNAAIAEAETLARAENAARTPAPASRKPARGKCTECGRKEDFRASLLCKACREYGESENAHADEDHEGEAPEGGDFRNFCQVCHPELDRRKPLGLGKSRVGMVIIAKGTEIHKSATFKTAAEAAGWSVSIHIETYEGGNTRHYADAVKGDEAIQLAWEGRAYDYAASSAQLGGKGRKVRNLKEALRLLAA